MKMIKKKMKSNANFQSNLNSDLHWPYVALSALVTGLLMSFVLLSKENIRLFITNPDQLTVISFAEDILHNSNFSLMTWSIPRAPYIFPDLVIATCIMAIVKNAYLTAFITFVFHSIFIFLAAFTLVSKIVYNPRAFWRTIVIFCIVTLLLSIFIKMEFVLWPFISISHASTLITSTLALVWCERFTSKGNLRKLELLTFFLFCFLSILSDKIFVLLFSVPYAIALLLSIKSRQDLARIVWFSLSQALAIGLSEAIYSKLTIQIMGAPDLISLPAHLISLWNSLSELPTIADLYYILSLAALFAMFGGACLALRGSRRLTNSEIRVRLFLGLNSLLGLALVIYLWTSHDFSAFRYGVSLQLGCLIAISWGAERVLAITFGLRTLKIVIGASAAAIVAAIAIHNIGDPYATVKDGHELDAQLHRCVVDENLHSGLADYWLAKKLTAASNWTIEVDQLGAGVPSPYFWGSNFSWFFSSISGVSKVHDFVIENNIEPSSIWQEYGMPDREIDCGPWRFAIYNNVSLDTKINQLFTQNGLLQKFTPYFMAAGIHANFDPIQLWVSDGSLAGDEGGGSTWINKPRAIIKLTNTTAQPIEVIWKAKFFNPPCIGAIASLRFDRSSPIVEVKPVVGSEEQFSTLVPPYKTKSFPIDAESPVCKLAADSRDFYFGLTNLRIISAQ